MVASDSTLGHMSERTFDALRFFSVPDDEHTHTHRMEERNKHIER